MALIYTGVLVLKLKMPWVKSLKEKRRLVLHLSEAIRQRYPCSLARIDGLNEHHWEVLAVSSIDGDAKRLEGVLSAIEEFAFARAECVLELLCKEVEVYADSREY